MSTNNKTRKRIDEKTILWLRNESIFIRWMSPVVTTSTHGVYVQWPQFCLSAYVALGKNPLIQWNSTFKCFAHREGQKWWRMTCFREYIAKFRGKPWIAREQLRSYAVLTQLHHSDRKKRRRMMKFTAFLRCIRSFVLDISVFPVRLTTSR